MRHGVSAEPVSPHRLRHILEIHYDSACLLPIASVTPGSGDFGDPKLCAKGQVVMADRHKTQSTSSRTPLASLSATMMRSASTSDAKGGGG
jgi:hypothetical protein